jgi:hypothetical protein
MRADVRVHPIVPDNITTHRTLCIYESRSAITRGKPVRDLRKQGVILDFETRDDVLGPR